MIIPYQALADPTRYFYLIKIPGLLPHYGEEYRFKKEERKKVRDHKEFYTAFIQEALNTQARSIFYEQAFVYILHIFPDTIPRDYDNRGRKYIFDALRANRVLHTDSWMHLQVFESGALKPGNSHTHVLIGDQKDTLEIIQFVQQFYISTVMQ